MKVFGTAFLPDTLYLKKFVSAHHPVIDLGEHFIKQTYRTRCSILSSNGPLLLSIPLRKIDSKRVGDQEISFTEDWQTKSLRAIRSSYKNSPYYEHYQQEFEELLMRREIKLHDYNRVLFEWLISQLQIETGIQYSEVYVNRTDIIDYRNLDLLRSESPGSVPYKQVFSHKMEFVPGLSGIDLLFNKGPEALPYLK